MQINEQFWGGEEQTTTSSNGTKWTSYTLKDALNQENNPGWQLPFNEEWDTSICPWAINPDADFMKIGYSTIYRDADNETHVVSASLLEKESSGIPIWFGVNASIGNTGSDFKWGGRNAYSQAYIQMSYDAHSNQYAMRSFDYSKLVYLIQVKVAQYQMEGADRYDYARGNVYDLASYIANYENLKSMPIIQIYMIPYYWSGNAEYPNQRNAIQLNINTLGRFKTIDKAFTDAGIDLGGSLSAETCYTNDYLDYFMSVMGGTTNESGVPSAAGIGIQPNGEIIGRNRLYLLNPNNGQWFRSFAEAINYNYTIGTLDSNAFNWSCRVINSDMWDLAVDSSYAANGYGVVRPELRVNEKFANAAEAEAYILKQAAYLGTWFVTNSSALQTEPGSSDSWYLGEIDEDGVTTGNYRQGSSTSELDNSTWENPWDSSGWNGRPVDPDPTDWDEDLQTITRTISLDQNIGCKDYLMTGHALAELIRVLSWYKAAEASGDINEGTCANLFGTSDPLECIQTVICYPYDLTSNWGGAEGTTVSGIYMSDTQGVYCGLTELVVNQGAPSSDTWYYLYTPYNSILEINWTDSSPFYGTKRIPYFDRYKSFLSYEPYCDAELYIPFCGTVKIDPQLFVGHQVGVLYSVSVSEGSCRADIYRDDLVIDSITGNMGAQIGLSSADIIAKVNAVQQANATISAQKTNLVKSLAGFGIAAAATVATGGTGAPLAASLGSSALGATASAVSAHQSIEMAEYQIKQAEVPFHKLTTGHGFLVLNSEDGIRLNVYRPTCLPGYTRTDWGKYGHTTGFACLKNDVLSNYHGLTVCSSVDLTGTTCTSKEAEMIKSALKTGVYLP